ncbi:hypothetical protein L2E82_34146 [Cichorium intybus]|uniref:Uncharacterized protein n=1 Tax=Cichorium intybus TaxID=13427 RepID=A0ACB9BLN0_CICIN|nr:hypothetical protein L2E82_34146 [Cichorium intybus]
MTGGRSVEIWLQFTSKSFQEAYDFYLECLAEKYKDNPSETHDVPELWKQSIYKMIGCRRGDQIFGIGQSDPYYTVPGSFSSASGSTSDAQSQQEILSLRVQVKNLQQSQVQMVDNFQQQQQQMEQRIEQQIEPILKRSQYEFEKNGRKDATNESTWSGSFLDVCF